VVRISGRGFVTLAALVARRPACDLYHSALVVTVPDGRYVIEATPIIDEHGDRWGVVAEGAVGSAWLGKRRTFHYEIRRWLNGVIPDTASAKVTTSIELAYADASRLLELVPSVPTSVWGRDELGAGEMWNSNSVTSWLLHRSGVDTSCLAPSDGGRPPGWGAGIEVAARTDTERPVSGRH